MLDCAFISQFCSGGCCWKDVVSPSPGDSVPMHEVFYGPAAGSGHVLEMFVLQETFVPLNAIEPTSRACERVFLV